MCGNISCKDFRFYDECKVYTKKEVSSCSKYLDVATKIDKILKELNLLSSLSRVEVFSNFCKYCGGANHRCQCWNDE